MRTIVTMLDPDEQDRLREMEEWIIKGEGTWVLSESFNTFLGRVLHDPKGPHAYDVRKMFGIFLSPYLPCKIRQLIYAIRRSAKVFFPGCVTRLWAQGASHAT